MSVHQLCSLSSMDLSMCLKGQKAQYFLTGSVNLCSMLSCSYFYHFSVASCLLQALVNGKITFPCWSEILCLPLIEAIVWLKFSAARASPLSLAARHLFWETLCLLHFISNVCTLALFLILHGPVNVSQGTKGAMFPYWIRQFLFYVILLLVLPLFCGLMPFASLGEWKDHFSLLVRDSLFTVD
jgi:hypothetical protein